MKAKPLSKVVKAISLALVLLLQPLIALPANATTCPSGWTAVSGGNCQRTFAFTGSSQTWSIPAGVSEITVDMQGAAGGSGGPNTTGVGGRGARVQGVIPVTGGSTLYIYVGGRGPSASVNAVNTNNPGGWNGGGGTYFTSDDNKRPGAGGGASDIRLGGTAFSDRIAVAGGGGGAGGWENVNGGDAGLNGEQGQLGPENRPGGTGGTQSAGGTGANSGSLGLGGAGRGGSHGGGGGGGGYYGGGGGSVAPGGGGSSFAKAGSTGVTYTTGFTSRTANGSVTITYLAVASLSSFTSSDSSPNNLSTHTYSMVFTASVSGIEAADFENAGSATGCSFSPDISSGTAFTVTVSGCSEGTLQPRLKQGSFLSNGETGPPSAVVSTTTLTIDRSAPNLSFSQPASPNRTNPVVVSLNSDEPLYGLSASDFSAPGCTVSVSGSASPYTVSLANCTDQATATLSLSGSVTDQAGNIAAAPSAISFVADRVFDGISITGPSSPTNELNLEFLVTPLEPLGAGALGALTSGEIQLWYAAGCQIHSEPTWTGTAFSFRVVNCQDQQSLQVRIVAGALGDVAGNLSSLTTKTVVTDRSLLIGVLVEPSQTLTNDASLTFTYNFGETISGLHPSDFSLSGASSGCQIDPFATQNNITSYSVIVSGCDHGTSVTLTLGTLTISDALMNLGPTVAVQSSTYVFDRLSPELVSVTPRATLQNSSTVVYDVVFSENVTGVTSSQFSSASAGCSAPTISGSGANYVLTLTGCQDGEVQLVASVTAAVTDAATNTLDASGASASASIASVEIDTVGPRVAWQSAPVGPLNSQATYLIDFNEQIDSSTFTASDITNIGTASGCVFSVQAVSATSFRVQSSGCGDGTLEPVILASSVNDLAGNSLALINTLAERTAGAVTLDFTLPTVTVSTTTSSPTNSNTLAYVLTYSEAVQTPSASSFAMIGGVTNCSITVVPSGANPDTVFDVSVTGCSQGLAVLTINSFSVADTAGNLGPANAVIASAVTIDRTPATVALTNQTASPTNQTTLVFSLVFNEPISSLVSDSNHFNLAGSGCSLGTLTGSQPGTTFSITVTGCDVSTTASISLKADSVLDQAGNASPAAVSSSASIANDRVAATVTAFDVLTPNDNGLVRYELEFDEPVTGLSSSDFSVQGVSSSGAVVVTAESSTRYVITMQALSSGTASLLLAANSVQDQVGNLSPLAAQQSETQLITFTALTGGFTVEPTLNAAGKINSSTLVWRLETNRALETSNSTKTLSSSDLVFTEGSCSALAVLALTSSVFEITGSGCSEGSIELQVQSNAVEDPDGNTWPQTPISSSVVVVDTLPPTASVASASGPSQMVRHTFQFDFHEPISGLTLASFAVAAGSTATGCSLSYTATSTRALVTASSCLDGTLAVSLLANSLVDEAGNIGPAHPLVSAVTTQTTIAPGVVSTPPAAPQQPQLMATAPATFVGPLSSQARTALLDAGVVQQVEGLGMTLVSGDFTGLPSPTAAAVIVEQISLQAGEKLVAEIVTDSSFLQSHDVVGYMRTSTGWVNLGVSQLSASGVVTTPAVFTEPGSYFVRLVVKPSSLQAMNLQAQSVSDSYVMGLGHQALELDITVQGQRVELVSPSVSTPTYQGPIISSLRQVTTAGGFVTFTGARLSTTDSAELPGTPLMLSKVSETSFTVFIPALQPGIYSLTITTDFGKLTMQDALRVTDPETPSETLLYQGAGDFSTKKMASGEVKIYARGIVGVGKVQFFVNGKEIAWVRAVDATDPKLRILNKNQAQTPYLVRTVSVKERVRIEIRVEGQRAKFATYNPAN